MSQLKCTFRPDQRAWLKSQAQAAQVSEAAIIRMCVEAAMSKKVLAWITEPVSIFRDHSCWKCQDGTKPCAVGNPRQCEYPHARND